MPVAFALTGAKADERETLLGMFDADPALVASRPAPDPDRGQELLRQARSRPNSPTPASTLLRPARKGEKPRAGQRFFKPLRQIIESINNTLKAQLDLERHGGRTVAGVAARVLQRILALTAAIWHNDHTGQPILRSLTAYDH